MGAQDDFELCGLAAVSLPISPSDSLGALRGPLAPGLTVVLMASHPWSNISPSALLMPVRLACLPSMASMLWYANSPAAQLAYTQRGSSRPV